MKSTIVFFISLLFLSFEVAAQACVELPDGISLRAADLPNGNCDYLVDLCIVVPSSPRPKRIEFKIDYDSDGNGSLDAQQVFNFIPGGSIPSGTHCLSAFSPSEEFFVPDIACNTTFKATITGFTSGSGGTGGDCTTTVGYVTESGYDTSLPINLSTFEGKALDTENLISWTTIAEENNLAQVVERSDNPLTGFEEVGRIYSAGNTNETNYYSIIDESPLDLSYYRLLSIDLDGTKSYSGLIVIERSIANVAIKKIYPNPAASFVTVEYLASRPGVLSLSLINATGAVYKSIIKDANNGVNVVQLDVNDLAPGIYILSIDDGNKIVREKLIKK